LTNNEFFPVPGDLWPSADQQYISCARRPLVFGDQQNFIGDRRPPPTNKILSVTPTNKKVF
jgi:hypothetical protein